MIPSEGEAKRIAEAVAIAILSAVGAGLASWGVEALKERSRASAAARAESERVRKNLRGAK